MQTPDISWCLGSHVKVSGKVGAVQYFTPMSLQEELESAGLSVDQMFGGLTGEPLQTDGNFIDVIASLN